MKSGVVYLAAGLMIAGSAMAQEMPPLAQKNSCVACHAIDHKVVGPPWMDVSKRYKGETTYKYSINGSAAPDAKEFPLVQGLMYKVSHGGHGNWGTMPMIANDPNETHQGEIKQLVQFILGLAK
jgi:cytochrome c551/c552